MIRCSTPDHLHRFLDWFVRRTFDDLMVPYEPSGPYLSDVLFRCSRNDSLYRLRSLNGQALHRLTDALAAEQREDLRPTTEDTDARSRNLKSPRQIVVASTTTNLPNRKDESRAYRRHLGDFALFLSGLFRSHLDQGGTLRLYLDEGEKAYRTIAEDDQSPQKNRLLFHDLSDHFEQYADALDYMRQVYLPGADSAREGFHRFRDELDEEWNKWEQESPSDPDETPTDPE